MTGTLSLKLKLPCSSRQKAILYDGRSQDLLSWTSTNARPPPPFPPSLHPLAVCDLLFYVCLTLCVASWHVNLFRFPRRVPCCRTITEHCSPSLFSYLLCRLSAFCRLSNVCTCLLCSFAWAIIIYAVCGLVFYVCLTLYARTGIMISLSFPCPQL
jgi:hypothetical protein